VWANSGMGHLGQLCYGTTALSALLILLAVYLRDPAGELQRKLAHVVNGLRQVEDQHIYVSPRAIVGYGACVDLLVSGPSLLSFREGMGLPQHFDDINTYEELHRAFAYYFQHGAATERYITNSTLFDELVKHAERIPGSRYGLGGNAPVMAMRLNSEGCQVVLASTLTEKHLKSIPSEIKVVGNPVKRDDIHLILEYKAGEQWGPYVTPRANRFIIHNDKHNPRVKALDALDESLRDFRPDLLVISGLQLMDHHPFAPGERVHRLKLIKDQMLMVKAKTKVHFEMASYTDPGLLSEIQQYIIPHADSLGMNEQELANLYSLYKYGNVSFATDSAPRVASVLDQMRTVFRKILKANEKVVRSRRLTRIHLHTLAFQAIMTDMNSHWKQSDIAAAKASLTAFRHVCASAEVDIERAALLMDGSFSMSVIEDLGRVVMEPEKPVSCWDEGPYQMCVAPGLVCTNASQTAGGGDNISAAALAMQL